MEESQTIFGIDMDIVEGMQYERGYISPYMATDMEKMEANLDDPYILTFIEEWKDQAAVDVHADSEHFQRIIPLLSDMTEEAIEISLYREVL
mgnify:CR=1 FL=1